MVLIPVAAGALFPLFRVLLNPVLAAAAMAMSSVSVVTNSLRLRAFRRPASAEAILHPPLRQRVADWSYLVGIAMVALAIGAAAMTFAQTGRAGHEEDTLTVALSRAELASARPVAVNATNLRFDPPTIAAGPNEIIRVQLANQDGVLHDWTVPGVPGAHVTADGSASRETTFRAPGPGSYPIVCTVPGHREAGMTGLLVVG